MGALPLEKGNPLLKQSAYLQRWALSLEKEDPLLKLCALASQTSAPALEKEDLLLKVGA